MDLSIIIISWNTKQLLQDCLDSIYKTTHNIKFEIFVVDNASSDGSPAMVERLFKKVILVKNKENIGFAKANNIAFPLVNGRYVLLLNSDTVVKQFSLDRAVEFMDKNGRVGALTPKILNADGSIQHPCYVKEPSIYVEFYECFELERILKIARNDSIPANDSICEVAHACGCSLFFRKEALDEVGNLDENMIFSYEDADICIRIRRNGWLIFYYPGSQIVHFGGASRSKHKTKVINAMLQSKYAFYKKYHGRLYISGVAACLILSSFIKGMVMTSMLFSKKRRTAGKSYIKYYWSIIFWHFKLNKKNNNNLN